MTATAGAEVEAVQAGMEAEEVQAALVEAAQLLVAMAVEDVETAMDMEGAPQCSEAWAAQGFW